MNKLVAFIAFLACCVWPASAQSGRVVPRANPTPTPALERAVRPLYCRLFPLWSFHGQLTWFTADECLANAECSALADMLGAMGTDGDEVRALFEEMCARLGLERTTKVTS